MIVSVYRNNNDPVFTGTTDKETTIREDAGVGSSVFQFQYTDVDPDVRDFCTNYT